MSGAASHCPPPDVLLAAVSGVLPEEGGPGIRAHLAECRYCQALVADLNDREAASPSPAELSRIRKRIDQAIAPSARRPFRLPGPAWLGAAFTVLAVALYLGLGRAPAPRETAGPPPAGKPTPPEVHLPLDKAPLKLPLASAIIWRGAGKPAGER